MFDSQQFLRNTGISPRGKARDFDSLTTGSNPVIPAYLF